MFVRSVVRAMVRRWYVLLLALACAAGLAKGWVADSGCYSTSTVVTFTRPEMPALLPDSGVNDENVIAFASTVATAMNGGQSPSTYASSDAPLYGVGVRQGVLVAMPNSGGQWVSSYARAEIEIQIVGRTRDWVAARQAELLAQVLETAESQQTASETDEDTRIVATVAPLTMSIHEVTVGAASQVIAGGALLLAAVIVAAWSSLWLDRRASRRRPNGPVGRGDPGAEANGA